MSLWLASEHVGRSFAHEREGTIDGGLSDQEVREYLRQVGFLHIRDNERDRERS